MRPTPKNSTAISLLIIIFIVLGPPPLSAAQFSDLNGHWSASSVYESKTLGLLNGYPDGSFKPEQYLTRLEALVVFMRAAGYSPDTKKNSKSEKTTLPANVVIPDVPWGRVYLEKAYADKILTQTELATYIYNAPASRAEIAVLLGRLFMLSLPASGETTAASSFSDLGQVSPEILPYVYAVTDAGLMTGYGDSTFRPENCLKRSEAAALLAQLTEKQWLKSVSSRVLEGWIKKHTETKSKGAIELVAPQGVKNIAVAPDCVCFKEGSKCPIDQALYWKVRVYTDNKNAAACIIMLEKRVDDTNEQTIRGTIKSVASGQESYIIINDLDAREQKIPVDWGMSIESSNKTGEKGLTGLKTGTFVELHLTNQKATRLVVLNVKNTSGLVERIDYLYLYLKSSGSSKSKSAVPTQFMNYSRARTVDKDGKSTSVIRGDSVKISYLEVPADSVVGEIPLEIVVNSRPDLKKVSGKVQSISGSSIITLVKNKIFNIDPSASVYKKVYKADPVSALFTDIKAADQVQLDVDGAGVAMKVTLIIK